ncbi:hypothetical protein HL658_10335 [Azospirillum sp. RWY-5-1]|uniref:Glycine zipper domain-containing protein n=1 Tax=Azospirillum oleiclasticum TaxID=2735135 RepID=A0ABX2TAV6_9PROT|nr:glycine zipper domain-containing protein [Azospirillum oleiclasticum]NYZ12950.1 hypothetical protein [Azospirillum oleiclasticum]NYZ20377.1 hypothetical protein [Azospirillum oleiclasticum]
MNADQKALADYSTDYAVAGAIGGAVLGCVLGALISNNRGAGCAGGAVAGGLAGGVAGYHFAQTQQQYAAAGAQVAIDRSKLTEEIAKAQNTRLAAERVSNDAKADIDRLKRQVASGQASQAQLTARVDTLNRDIKNTRAAADRMRTKIGEIESDIARGNMPQSDRVALTRARDQLRQELAKLEEYLGAMEGTAGVAGV